MNNYEMHYQYLNPAIKKIKRSVRYFINKGETDMWHSVKIDLNDDPDAVLRFLYYDFHILLDQINENDPYEIDVYPVFFDGRLNFGIDTSELLFKYQVPFKNGGKNEKN